MLSDQSTTKDYNRAEHKLRSISKLFISQVTFFEPVYIPWALNTGTCIQQDDLFHSADLHGNYFILFHLMGLVLRRRNGAEKKHIIIIIKIFIIVIIQDDCVGLFGSVSASYCHRM